MYTEEDLENARKEGFDVGYDEGFDAGYSEGELDNGTLYDECYDSGVEDGRNEIIADLETFVSNL